MEFNINHPQAESSFDMRFMWDNSGQKGPQEFLQSKFLLKTGSARR